MYWCHLHLVLGHDNALNSIRRGTDNSYFIYIYNPMPYATELALATLTLAESRFGPACVGRFCRFSVKFLPSEHRVKNLKLVAVTYICLLFLRLETSHR